MRKHFPAAHREFCEAIGYLSLAWAMAEMALDAIISRVHGLYGGSEISDLRQCYVHGVNLSTLENTDGEVVFRKVARGNYYTPEDCPVTIADIDALGTRCFLFGSNLMLFGMQSVEVITEDDFNKLIRQFAVKSP